MKRSRRLRAAAVKRSTTKLVKRSLNGVWMFRQTDELSDGSRRTVYLVYDRTQMVIGKGDPISSYREAVAEFDRREKDLLKAAS